MAAITKNRNFFKWPKLLYLSQKVPKFELYKQIEQFWPFEEISIFSHGGHLGYRTALTDILLKGDHPRIISAKFGCELYKHNDELFNLYYGIFYEL
jgi:hypothetical protein